MQKYLLLIFLSMSFNAFSQLQRMNSIKEETKLTSSIYLSGLPNLKSTTRPVDLDTNKYASINNPVLTSFQTYITSMSEAKKSRDTLQTQLTQKENEYNYFTEQKRADSSANQNQIVSLNKSITSLKASLKKEKDNNVKIRLQQQIDIANNKSQQLQAEISQSELDKYKMQQQIIQLKADADKADAEFKKQNEQSNQLKLQLMGQIDSLNKEMKSLRTKLNNANRQQYTADSLKVSDEYAELKTFYDTLKKTIDDKIDSLNSDNWSFANYTPDTASSHSLLKLQTQLTKSSNDIKYALIYAAANLPKLQEEVENFRKKGIILNYFADSIPPSFDEQIKANIIALNTAFNEENKNKDQFVEKYQTFKSSFEEALAKLQAQLKNKKDQSSDGSVLANFTQPLNASSSLVPSIDIFAYKKFSSRDLSMLGQAKLFLAAPGSDTNTLDHTTKLFIPEASQFGFMADFSFGFLQATNHLSDQSEKKLAINLSFYYLQKQLVNKDDKTSFPIGLIQTKVGMELILIKNALAIYSNLTGIYVGKGLERYKKYYDDTQKMKWYTELGLKSYLVLSADAKVNLLLDLRFLPVNPVIRHITQTQDKFIPLFKLGIVKDFDF